LELNRATSAEPPILAVSFLLPPTPSAQSIQIGRLLAALDRPMVVLKGEDPAMGQDPTLNFTPLHPQTTVLNVPYAISDLRRRFCFHWQRLGLPFLWNNPDRFRVWIKPALKALAEYLKISGLAPRIIVTFGQPWSDHLAGLELKRRLGLPWVAHFSDPWADADLFPGDRLSLRWNKVRERRVMEKADMLIFVSPETVERVLAPYPARVRAKARVLPHSYDPALYPDGGFKPGPVRVIRYLGDFYHSRDPRLLVEPLKILLGTSPQLLENVCFEIFSDYPEDPRSQAPFEALPPGLLSFRGKVPYLESLKLMCQADALLVVNMTFRPAVWLPSKLIEYLGAGRPILGITPPGAAHRVLRDLKGWVADPQNPQDVARMLADFLARPSPPSPWGNEKVRESYQVSRQARAFAELLAEVL